MSGRNGIAGRRGGRETPSAPVSDEGAGELLARLALALEKAENERDEWKARAKQEAARARRLAKDVLRLDKRLNGGKKKRDYMGGNFHAQERADILADCGYVTKRGEPPTRYWIYRLNRYPDDAPSWITDPDISREDFRRKAIEAAAGQRAIPAELRTATTWRR